MLYPLAWGLCEGGNVIPSDSEAMFYGILDQCATPVFSIMLVVGHWDIDPGRLDLKIRGYDEDPKLFEDSKRIPGEDSAYSVSSGLQNGNNAATNGHNNGIDGHTEEVHV